LKTASKIQADFRSATESKKAPNALADGVAGMRVGAQAEKFYRRFRKRFHREPRTDDV
jgi:hypothetical protein